MKISIVIPTLHRRKSLVRLLKQLKNLKLQIIVAEQEENNQKIFSKFCKIDYIFLQRRSTPRAMNEGVKRVKGDYVLFLDDDVSIAPNLVENHIRNFIDKKVAATVGRVITEGQSQEPYRKDTGRINWKGEFSDGFSSTVWQEVDTVIGCNMCWRKDIFLKLGGFDESYTGNALRFESDLSLRAKKLGYKIIFEPKALVRHIRVKTGGARKTEGRIRWYIDFFKNETLFFVTHKPLYLLPIFICNKFIWVLTNI